MEGPGGASGKGEEQGAPQEEEGAAVDEVVVLVGLHFVEGVRAEGHHEDHLHHHGREGHEGGHKVGEGEAAREAGGESALHAEQQEEQGLAQDVATVGGRVVVFADEVLADGVGFEREVHQDGQPEGEQQQVEREGELPHITDRLI